MGHFLIQRSPLMLAVCMLAFPSASGLFEWLRSPQPPPPPPPPAAPALLAEDARFEMVTADEKFLAEAKQLELSPLDSCHYRVVARLRSSCESLSEENLAKLGVELFNCQAEIEGRRTFLCTEEMTIKECTSDMDPDTWNAYHIVSNRARSVCYAARQQLFRRRAELTVNSLISTATTQLETMKDLKEGQLKLKELTAASLDKLLQGHSALQAQQGKLHVDQEQMGNSLRDNLERLGQEKALIASGQELVFQLIQGITKQMENMSEHLQVQSSEVQDGHKAVVSDLAGVRHQAEDIQQKIDLSVSEFLQYQDQTSLYYGDLMAKLERMNGTLGATLHYLESMQTRIEDRLHMIQGYLGWAGLSLSAMWTCITHTGYFLLCAVLLTFLRCSAFSRALLLLVVPLNAAAELNQQPALDLPGLSLLLLSASLCHWFACRAGMWLQSWDQPAAALPLGHFDTVEPQMKKIPCPLSSTPQRANDDCITGQEDVLCPDSFLSGEFGISAVSSPQRKPLPVFGLNRSTPKAATREDLSEMNDIHPKNLGRVFDFVNDSRDFEMDSRSSSPVLSTVSNSSLSARLLCNGITKTGKACKKRAVAGQEFCRVHEGGHDLFVQL